MMREAKRPNDPFANDWWDPELNLQSERLAEKGAPKHSPLRSRGWYQWAALGLGIGLLVLGLPRLKRLAGERK
jgi:hypothetical protein